MEKMKGPNGTGVKVTDPGTLEENLPQICAWAQGGGAPRPAGLEPREVPGCFVKCTPFLRQSALLTPGKGHWPVAAVPLEALLGHCMSAQLAVFDDHEPRAEQAVNFLTSCSIMACVNLK